MVSGDTEKKVWGARKGGGKIKRGGKGGEH